MKKYVLPTQQKGYPLVCPSELRLDLLSKDWVVIASGRAKRPSTFTKHGTCPFCKIHTREDAVLAMKNGKKITNVRDISSWTTLVFPNHFPAFIPHCPPQKRREGPLYQAMNATGFHEVIVTRDHTHSLADMSLSRVREVIETYHMRFKALAKEKIVSHVFIFHNHGQEAGASIAHPHSQIATLPFVNPDLRNALLRAKKFYRKTGKCVYCELNAWERKSKTRIVFENKDFLVVCPFASKQAFEMIISPKRHLSYFERISESQKDNLAKAFSVALRKLKKGLKNPPYNFYLHTTPMMKEKDEAYYHWHWTILPRIEMSAGFELGVGIEITTVAPELAAEHLRNQRV
jgi:UDPglucose--hexose-1-phosphate uridylyltransferase